MVNNFLCKDNLASKIERAFISLLASGYFFRLISLSLLMLISLKVFLTQRIQKTTLNFLVLTMIVPNLTFKDDLGLLEFKIVPKQPRTLIVPKTSLCLCLRWKKLCLYLRCYCSKETLELSEKLKHSTHFIECICLPMQCHKRKNWCHWMQIDSSEISMTLIVFWLFYLFEGMNFYGLAERKQVHFTVNKSEILLFGIFFKNTTKKIESDGWLRSFKIHTLNIQQAEIVHRRTSKKSVLTTMMN